MRKFEFKRRQAPVKGVFALEDAIHRFSDQKRLQKRSERTIQTYNQTLQHFAKFCATNDYTGDEEDCVTEYVRYMTFEKVRWDDHPTSKPTVVGVSARSINNAIRNLRVFYNWAVAQRLIEFSPASNVSVQAEDEDTFEVFTDEEVEALLAAPNKRTYTGYRDYVMMALIIDTGMRIGELAEMKYGYFDLNYRQVHIPAEIAKHRRARTIPISSTVAGLLRELFAMIGLDGEGVDSDDEYVFLSQYGERYYGGTFAKMLKKYEKRVSIKIKARVSPHTFRHYFAVKFLRNGGDTFALMKILGHKDLSMTQKYVRYVEADLQEVHDKASPIESLTGDKRKKRGSVKFK